MTATAFDTLKAVKTLKDAGLDEAQAEAIVTTVDDAAREHTASLASDIATVAENMATKESVSMIADNVATIADTMATKEHVSATAENMATNERFEAAMEKMATKEYVTLVFAELRAEMAAEFKALNRHLWVMGTSIVVATVALNKLLS